jgi:hypothetical protein
MTGHLECVRARVYAATITRVGDRVTTYLIDAHRA